MTVITSPLNVLLPNVKDWQIFDAGKVFLIAEITAYLCQYLAK
nr:hypothetical protein [Gilliamella apicola]